jgi:hypothetical protein
MRRQWYLAPVRSYMGVDRPEEFYLRPGLELGKYPEHRSIQLGLSAGGERKLTLRTPHLGVLE